MNGRIRFLIGSALVIAIPNGAGRMATVASSTNAPSYLVLVVLDGARPDYLSVPGIPHVRALIDQGTQYTNAWAGILESETPSGHAAIATGSEPRRNGILGFGWLTGRNHPVSIFDPAKVRAGLMEQLMSESGAPTIASLVHAEDPSAEVVALSGSKYYAADAAGGPDADITMYFAPRSDHHLAPTYVPPHAPPDEILTDPTLVATKRHVPAGGVDQMAMKLAASLFRSVHQRVTLINLPEFDWPLGHIYGADRASGRVRTLMRAFDRDLGVLEDTYRDAGVLDRTLFVLTADHGFAGILHTVSAQAITAAVRAAGTSMAWETYHTAAFLWLRDRRRASAAAKKISQLRMRYIQSVYYRSPPSTLYRRVSPRRFQVPDVETANQYLLKSFAGSDSPDVVIFFTENSASLPAGEATWKGDHGGAAWESQHIPLVFSGLGVAPGRVSAYPARLVDIAPTALTLLGIVPEGMQGVPLADAMASPAPGNEQAQASKDRTLQPLVEALRAQSRVEQHVQPQYDDRPAVMSRNLTPAPGD